MREDTQKLVNDFLEFMKSELGVSELPEIEFVGKDFSDEMHSFGQWDGSTIKVVLKGRHPMDVLRTLAHEIIHQVKNHSDGSDGSPDENEANALAGKFMRKFGKTKTDGFGLKAEGRLHEMFKWGAKNYSQDASVDTDRKRGHEGDHRGYGGPDLDSYPNSTSDAHEKKMEENSLKAFFESAGGYAEGFETPNQGQTRQPGQHGPESTSDVDPSGRDITSPEVHKLVWNPGEYGADINKVLSYMGHGPLRDKLESLGSYGEMDLNSSEASALNAALEAFRGNRTYSKPDVEFVDDVMANLAQKNLEENVSGHVNQEQGFDIASMERHPTPEDYSEEQFNRPKQEDYSLEQLPNGFVRLITPDGNEQVFSNMDKAEQYRDWHKSISDSNASLKEMFAFESIEGMKKSVKYMKQKVGSMDKESKKEKKEHPWATDVQAQRIAKDHARKEGKMESVFRKVK